MNHVDRWDGFSIGRAFDEAVTRWGNKEAMVFSDARFTLKQLRESINDHARSFLKLGVRKGDRVVVWMAGYKEWAYLYYSLASIGAIIVPINTRYRPEELRYSLQKTRSRVLVFRDEKNSGKDYYEILKASYAGSKEATYPDLDHIISVGSRELGDVISYPRFLSEGKDIDDNLVTEASRNIRGEDPFAILFTSGTTGRPKGAVLTHSGVLNCCYYCRIIPGFTAEDRYFSPSPFFHSGGFIGTLPTPVVVGSTIIIQPYFNHIEALDIIEKEKCTIASGHQPHWVDYLNQEGINRRKFSLRMVLWFSTCNPTTVKLLREIMHVPLATNSYGLTELFGIGILSPDDPEEKRLLSVGKPVTSVDVQIRNPADGSLLRVRAQGEICAKSSRLFKGYWEDSEQTTATFYPDGWFRTGDLGFFDEDGYLYVSGRLKEVIRVGGENVGAGEVEQILLEYEKIKQAIVIGIADERLGEVPLAWVELKENQSAAEEEILQYARGRLARYKVPRAVIFTKEWPLTGTGKIERSTLKKKTKEILSNP